MQEREVTIVGETPSLGRAIEDLLEADHLRCRYVADLSELESGNHLADGEPPHRIVIAASNTRTSPTARAWIRGELPATELIVVGSRDPMIATSSGIHLLRLPLPRNMFLRYVRGLLDLPPEPPEPVGPPALAST